MMNCISSEDQFKYKVSSITKLHELSFLTREISHLKRQPIIKLVQSINGKDEKALLWQRDRTAWIFNTLTRMGWLNLIQTNQELGLKLIDGFILKNRVARIWPRISSSRIAVRTRAPEVEVKDWYEEPKAEPTIISRVSGFYFF